MNDLSTDRTLFTASKNLDKCLVLMSEILMFLKEIENTKNQQEELDKTGGSINLSIGDSFLSSLQDMIDRARDEFPVVITEIKKRLHIFAKCSVDVVNLDVQPLTSWKNKYGFEYLEPNNIVGTSAHHAGVLLLESALLHNFWGNPDEDPFPVFNLYNHYQAPSIDFNLLWAKIEREQLIAFEPGLESLKCEDGSPPFDDVMTTFTADDGNSVTFKGEVRYSLFKCVHENNGRSSFDELRKCVPKWKKDGASDDAISQAKIGVNKDLADANMLDQYELVITNKTNILFRTNYENEPTN
ncbi:hypothetical protein [Gimesia panareensis]|uniref:hypothetical protein n=1 Tax=Gimesia panareensis TaxID=2527978 RepID=UPI00118BE937|nr:hypothetical protein [Gimesia panareensis]QDU50281.1 hypothetical protein Pan110_26260 [Gimesia panareensis]